MYRVDHTSDICLQLYLQVAFMQGFQSAGILKFTGIRALILFDRLNGHARRK